MAKPPYKWSHTRGARQWSSARRCWMLLLRAYWVMRLFAGSVVVVGEDHRGRPPAQAGDDELAHGAEMGL